MKTHKNTVVNGLLLLVVVTTAVVAFADTPLFRNGPRKLVVEKPAVRASYTPPTVHDNVFDFDASPRYEDPLLGKLYTRIWNTKTGEIYGADTPQADREVVATAIEHGKWWLFAGTDGTVRKSRSAKPFAQIYAETQKFYRDGGTPFEFVWLYNEAGYGVAVSVLCQIVNYDGTFAGEDQVDDVKRKIQDLYANNAPSTL